MTDGMTRGQLPLFSGARIESLDGMRGIAALIVVLSHFKHVLRNANALSGDHWDEWLLSWPIRLLWGGDEAVVSFFVLSGFVLAMPFLRPRQPAWLPFMGRRILRLYPAYIAALVLSTACAWVLHSHRTDTLSFILDGYLKEDVPATTLAGYALLLIDGNSVNPALWALVQALRVALVFPFVFAIIRHLRAGLSLILFAMLSVTVVAIIGEIPPQSGWSVLRVSFLKTGYFLFFFVLGSVLAIHRDALLERLAGPWREGRLAFAIIGVGLLGMRWYLPYLAGPLVVGLGFVIVLLVALATPSVGAVLQSAALQFLGTISYSLFLIHLPVIYAMVYLLYGTMPIGAILLLTLPVAILAAWLFWFAIERPSMGWSRRVVVVKLNGPAIAPAGAASDPASPSDHEDTGCRINGRSA